MAKLLAIRFSALGDVAMTVPVLYAFAEAYPEHQLVVLSRSAWAPFFQYAPSNLLFRGIDLKNYSGIRGLSRLYRELYDEHFDAVADLHDVLRTKYLRWRFRLSGVPVSVIDKGRKEKRQLTLRKRKVLRQLSTSFERYQFVFRKLGYSFPCQFHSLYGNRRGDERLFEVLGIEKNNDCWVGIAPFAAHQGKIYPLELQEEVVRELSAKEQICIFLFGGGSREKEILDGWAARYPHVVSVVGKLKMDGELALMSWLDVMVTMDSGNMHLASLVGTPVVSVWGATHPYAGFMGWKQSEERAVQLDLPCRPCSIYGNRPCLRGDYACLKGISPSQLVEQVLVVYNDCMSCNRL